MDTLETTVANESPIEQVEQQVDAVESQPSAEPAVELTEEEKAQAETDKQAKVKQDAINKRFAEMTRQRHESERRAQQAEQNLNELRQKYEAPKVLELPQLENFETIGDYQKAVREHAENEVRQQVVKEFNERQQAQQTTEAGVKFQQAEAEFVKAHPDYEQVAEQLTSIVGSQGLPQHVSQAILQSSDAPALIYELGQNLEEFSDFLDMPAHEQLMKLGEIRAGLKVNGSSAPRTPAAINQPKPITPVSSNAPLRKDVTKMSTEEYIEHRNKTSRR